MDGVCVLPSVSPEGETESTKNGQKYSLGLNLAFPDYSPLPLFLIISCLISWASSDITYDSACALCTVPLDPFNSFKFAFKNICVCSINDFDSVSTVKVFFSICLILI